MSLLPSGRQPPIWPVLAPRLPGRSIADAWTAPLSLSLCLSFTLPCLTCDTRHSAVSKNSTPAERTLQKLKESEALVNG